MKFVWSVLKPLVVVGIIASTVNAMDMDKFRDAMQKTQGSIRGLGELMKTIPPLLSTIKTSIDQMKVEIDLFKRAGKPSEKILKINTMNQLVIQDLKVLTQFISNIGQLVIAPIDAKPAAQTADVAMIMGQMIDMIEQLNSMIIDISQSVAIFEA